MAIVDGMDAQAIARAAEALAAGELVAFPTETVYGLGARADDDAAVAKIFAAKGRPADHPLIVHVADAADAQAFADAWPESARRLAEAFWPGPLTVIVPRRPGIGTASAGGQASIGLRCPAHPVAHALLVAARARGVPGVSGPSANRFGRISPTSAAHVREEFGDALAIVDGGECEAGIESAIVDCTRAAPALLRPGVLTRAQLEAVLGGPLRAPGDDAPRASGTLEAHYAPRAKLRLMPAAQLRTALQVLPKSTVNPVAVYSRTVAPGRSVRASRTMPDEPIAAAHELFAALRELDACGASLIWVETPPDGPAWEGVRDRLQRAAAA
ncbi:MAG: L-threonylcarbamoyladenylate synthase [Burkholderiaceae bacterium]